MRPDIIIDTAKKLVAAIVLNGVHSFHADRHAFVRVLDEARIEPVAGLGSVFTEVAARFEIYDGPVGRISHDFDEVLTYAHSAGFIGWISPEFTHAYIRMQPNTAKHLLDGESSMIERGMWLLFAEAFLKEVSHERRR